MTRASRCLLIAGLALFAACGGPRGTDDDVVNVYSHRHYEADQQLFDRFTERTGIRVNVVTASADELITRLENEGAASPADVLITVDAGRLHRAKVRHLLQPVTSDVLEAQVPGHLRDRDRQWWGLTQRARVLAYHRDRVDPAELDRYETLTDERWRGRLLVRSSDNVYNQSMLAALIAHHGEDAAERWARGIVANMARQPSGGDTDQVKAVAAGVGDVAIVNTYYIARLAESADSQERRVAERIGVVFPNQSDTGTHINVSGAGITRHAHHVGHALALLEFLTGAEAQALFAETNHEYPVNPEVPWSGALRAWGEFHQDTLDLTRLGELNEAAVRIFDRSGWR
jgi:iron(III) transport system substrate-binding protein